VGGGRPSSRALSTAILAAEPRALAGSASGPGISKVLVLGSALTLRRICEIRPGKLSAYSANVV